jgi:hypothetical protein
VSNSNSFAAADVTLFCLLDDDWRWRYVQHCFFFFSFEFARRDDIFGTLSKREFWRQIQTCFLKQFFWFCAAENNSVMSVDGWKLRSIIIGTDYNQSESSVPTVSGSMWKKNCAVSLLSHSSSLFLSLCLSFPGLSIFPHLIKQRIRFHLSSTF